MSQEPARGDWDPSLQIPGEGQDPSRGWAAVCPLGSRAGVSRGQADTAPGPFPGPRLGTYQPVFTPGQPLRSLHGPVTVVCWLGSVHTHGVS